MRECTERNWPTIGPHLAGEILFCIGDKDEYFENTGVYLFEQFLACEHAPQCCGYFEYGRPRKGYGWLSVTDTYQIAKTELVVSRLAYGCASLTPWDSNAVSAGEKKHAAELIHAALDQGITLFDHADIYAFGKSELVFGQILKESPGLRDKMVIQSKCGHTFREGWKGGDPVGIDLSGSHIVNSVEGILRRLQTDRVDVLLLHIPSALIKPDEVAHAFDQLHQSGKVRYFGVSNFNATQTHLLKKVVRQPIIANQIALGLENSDPMIDGMEVALEVVKGGLSGYARYMSVSGPGTIDYCRTEDIQIQAYSPMPRWLLSPKPDAKPAVKAAAGALAQVAQSKNSTPSAVALAWLLHHPAAIVPVIGTTKVEHIIDNCAATRVTLTDEEWYQLFAATADIKARAAQA